ncbi:MAG TPA: carbohydrate binding domain-containing protein [Mobilitalea sp.]|nr:carbohydrate binding domain-containing protein [Mobilitalea sp.]
MNTNLKRVMKVVTTFVLALTFMVTAVSPAIAATKSPALNSTSVKLVVGKTYTFKVNNAVKGSTYAWSTSNKKVVTVSKGVAKAVGKGTAYVYCNVTVNKKVTSKLKAKVTVSAAAASTATPIVSEDFSKDAGGFMGRGSASLKQVNEPGEDGKNGYLMVTGRTDAWHGADIDVTSKVKPGKSYTVTGWVKYTDGAATESFKITQQKNGDSWPAISGDVEVKKGQWTKVTGTMTVDADTTQCEVYFETSTNKTISFMADDFTIVEQ